MSREETRLRWRQMPWPLRWPGLALLAGLALAWRGSQGSLAALLGADARRALGDFLGGFWPPAHSLGFLLSLGRPLAETVAIAALGMALAIALGLPLALAGTSTAVYAACGGRPGPWHRALYLGARLALDLMRSVPELIWALLFVRALGIGPGPGVLAVGIAYGGVVGKVVAEILESVPRRPAEALAAAGSRPLAALLLGIGPSARPLVASYVLYRFDCALRASAVLGIVGAGGVGQQIELSLKMFRYDEVSTFVIALFALVASVDFASHAVRRWLASRASLFPASRRSVGAGLALGLGGTAALAAAAALLDLSPAALLSGRTLRAMADYVRSLVPPDLSGAALAGLLPAAGETLAVSVLGTALAAAGGLVLAYMAAHRLHSLAADAEPRALRAARAGAAVLARAVMNLERTLPELLWALLFIFAVGLGLFAGALALGVHTAGVLGRLYAEVLEEMPEGPLLSLRAAGASRLGTAVFGVLPQAFPQLVAYTLYRWEVNIRASAVLGVVGAGGLGQALHVAVSLFQGPRALTIVLAVLALVTAVDLFSGWLRERILRGAPEGAPSGGGAEAFEGSTA